MPNTLTDKLWTCATLATVLAGAVVLLYPPLFGAYPVERARQLESLAAPRDISREIIKRSEVTGSFPTDFSSSADIAKAYGKNHFGGKTIGSLLRTLNPNGGVFVPNQALAGMPVLRIKDPESVVLLYETEVWPNGKRLIVTAAGNGHIVEERDFTLELERDAKVN
jgi:hypothetical protein